MWQGLMGGQTFPYLRCGLTTFCCLVSSPKIVTRYLLSELICQMHLSRNLYLSLWLLLLDCDQASIHPMTYEFEEKKLRCSSREIQYVKNISTLFVDGRHELPKFLFICFYFSPWRTTMSLWSVLLTLAYHKERIMRIPICYEPRRMVVLMQWFCCYAFFVPCA